MRACPKCGRTYADEYNFCLVDGAFLSVESDDPDKTEFFGQIIAPDSVPTIDSRPKPVPAPTVKVDSTAAEPPLPTIAAFTPKPFAEEPAEKKRKVTGMLLNIALGVVGVIVIVGVIAGIVVGIVKSSRENNVAAVANKSPQRSATPTPKPSETPSATPTPTPEPTPTKPIVIPNPTLDPRSLPAAQMPNMEGKYDLRPDESDFVVMSFEVYDQDGTNFYIENADDKLYGTAHLDRTEKGEFMGYVVWENSAGEKDREIMYLCASGLGLCGKLPFQSWLFVATKSQ
jgi:hypothetical protein